MERCKYLDVYVDNDGLQTITFNRPQRKNAINVTMLKLITSLLRDSSSNSQVKVTAFTGMGDYFTSGNDLSNFTNPVPGESEETEATAKDMLEFGKNLFHELVAAFIDYPKPLVAVVNGPAIGIGVTLLAHFDLVFASSHATFHCPFVSLGQTPEGCSSFLFPLLMGHSKASQILLFGKKISAQEAFENNLVTEVFEPDSISCVWERIRNICSMPPNTLRNAKSLLKRMFITQLHKVNDDESNCLYHQWGADEFFEALSKFSSRKSKL